MKPGSKSTVQVFRRGAYKDLSVVVAEIEPDKVKRTAEAETKPQATVSTLGIGVSDLNDAQKRELKLKSGVRVEIADGAAARAGLPSVSHSGKALKHILATFPRDELLQGFMALSMSSSKKMSMADCDAALAQVTKNLKTVKPKDDEDHQIIQAGRDLYAIAPNCFARAGDCKKARAVFDAHFPVEERFKDVKDPAIRKSGMDATFDAMVSKCKAKPAQ